MLDHIWAEVLHVAEAIADYIAGFNPAESGNPDSNRGYFDLPARGFVGTPLNTGAEQQR
jgi:hypothetical protein